MRMIQATKTPWHHGSDENNDRAFFIYHDFTHRDEIIMHMPFKYEASRQGLLMSVGVVLLLAACSSVPVPTEQLTRAQTTIVDANTAGAGAMAPVELKAAQDKYDAAQKAVADHDNEKAKYLAEQAEVDAQVAAAKARDVKSQTAAAAVQADLRVLRTELNRASTNANKASN